MLKFFSYSYFNRELLPSNPLLGNDRSVSKVLRLAYQVKQIELIILFPEKSKRFFKEFSSTNHLRKIPNHK